jgi:hypothetical protein
MKKEWLIRTIVIIRKQRCPMMLILSVSLLVDMLSSWLCLTASDLTCKIDGNCFHLHTAVFVSDFFCDLIQFCLGSTDQNQAQA